MIRLLDDHALTSPSLTGDWEHRLSRIEQGEEARQRFMADIAQFAGATVTTLDEKLKDIRIPRANLGPCPVCGHDIVENRKGFSCWSREDPGLRLRDLEEQGGQDAAAGGRPRADLQGPHREGRHRLQGPLRPLLPREARADADRRGPLARRVRRAVGPRGRQAARGRGRSRPRPRFRRRSPKRPSAQRCREKALREPFLDAGRARAWARRPPSAVRGGRRAAPAAQDACSAGAGTRSRPPRCPGPSRR